MSWMVDLLGWKFLLREPKQQFLHDSFTIESKGEKKWGDSFSVQCVYLNFEIHHFMIIFMNDMLLLVKHISFIATLMQTVLLQAMLSN